jgi:hypothetical protein
MPTKLERRLARVETMAFVIGVIVALMVLAVRYFSAA